MSERAVVCPHCNARQAERDPLRDANPPKKKTIEGITRDEAAALLAIHGVDRPIHAARSGMAAVLLPHLRATGAWRWIDLACMAVALPAVVCAVPYLIVLVRYARRLNRGTSLGAHVGMAVLGTSGVYALSSWMGAPSVVSWALFGATTAALLVRGTLHAVLG